MSLDRGTKIYAAVLGSILLLVLLIWLFSLDFRLGEIDGMLAQEPDIAAYPYTFQALAIQGRTVVMSTPRSTSMPAVRFLSMIKPSLANKSELDPAVIEAQKELARLQSKVRKLVQSREDIDNVRWHIDKQWYADRGILVD
ncbi:MAG: hypothetical protein KZQ77_12150 [Candidatus Thiodiazotropha sp. (ex Notomyrtea botanica)]|nr:hypothetical protein [Candidatus Thiodiazotropha sp. (ex Notomyrtea botanica)]